jgi:hypothetical protein
VWVRASTRGSRGTTGDGTALWGPHPRLAALSGRSHVSRGWTGPSEFDVNALKGRQVKQSRQSRSLEVIGASTATCRHRDRSGRHRPVAASLRRGGLGASRTALDACDASENDPDDLEDRAGTRRRSESQKDVSLAPPDVRLLPVNDLRKGTSASRPDRYTSSTPYGMDAGPDTRRSVALQERRQSPRDDVSCSTAPDGLDDQAQLHDRRDHDPDDLRQPRPLSDER